MPAHRLKMDVSIFANTRHKSVVVKTSFEQAVAIRIFYYEADSSVCMS